MIVTLWCLAGTLLAVLAPALGYHLLRPAKMELHWTERARRLAPLRACLALGGLTFVPGSLWLGWQQGGWRLGVSCGVASFVGLGLSARLLGLRILRAMEVSLPFERADPRRSFLGRLPLQLAWLAPFAAMAWRPGGLGLALTALTLGLALLYIRFQSRWLRLVGHFREAPARLKERLRDLEGGRAVRGIFQTELGLANAMALPWSRELTVTRGALRILTEEELDAVLSHELEHLEEPLAVRLSRLGPLLGRVLLGAAAGYTASLGDLPLGLLILLGSAGAALLVWRLALELWSRGERDADHAGHGQGGAAYGRALLALYRANLFPIGSVTSGGHAPLLERLAAHGVELDFAPPGRQSQLPALLTMMLAAVYAVGVVALTTG